ncbi:alpha/beta hydrolase [Bosea sp. NPDC003192]|uniref:alpha/beta hydrolase n=1 Tax=Bosea sp. NPDC003192 TaxID=3390551 RepID=UPI003CFC3420
MGTLAAIPETIWFDLVPRAGGAPYRIFLRIPPGEPPADGWPAIHLLDANAVIATTVEVLRVQAAYPLGTGIGDAVVVGIGYPAEGAYDSVRRSWDYGPPPGRSYPPHSEGGPEVRTGGAETFLNFIEDELKPAIASRVRLDAARQAIFGHSFGGLFVLYALFTRPGAFRDWIAISPAIWWEEHNLLRFAPDGRLAVARSARVLLGVGEYEQDLAPFQRGAADAEQRSRRLQEAKTIDETRAMAGHLTEAGCDATFAVFEGETHMSVLPVAINRAVRFAFGPQDGVDVGGEP